MRLLWLCNIVFPELADVFGFRKENMGGWLTSLWQELKEIDDLELAVCVPIRNSSRAKDGVFDNYRYYSFLTISQESDTSIDKQIERFEDIIDIFKPEIIHIWGTEFEHSYSLVKAIEKKGLIDRTVINLQGLLTYCEKVFDYGISDNILDRKVNGLCIRDAKKTFFDRSKYERYILKNVKHVIGRTDWDKACTKEINSRINYHHCGELLREVFYLDSKWTYDNCNKHTIFISQAAYPIKGLHLIIESIAQLGLMYPDLKVRIAGPSLMTGESCYGKLIIDEIHRLKLEKIIEFIGGKTDSEMVEEYLKANVFISPSTIENSSNSICEAMMKGTPVIASFVGGNGSIIQHGISGFMYPLSETELLTYYVSLIFEDKSVAEEISYNEIKRAHIINNKNKVLTDMLDIYKEISNQ